MRMPKYKSIHPVSLFDVVCLYAEFELPKAPGPVTEMPEFEQHTIPAYQIYKDKPRPVNLVSHPRAIRFKDRLIQGSQNRGPNFGAIKPLCVVLR